MMGPDTYSARAEELLARAKVEQDPELAEMLECIAAGFHNGSFGPEEIKVMTEAYEAALIDLPESYSAEDIAQVRSRIIFGLPT